MTQIFLLTFSGATIPSISFPTPTNCSVQPSIATCSQLTPGSSPSTILQCPDAEIVSDLSQCPSSSSSSSSIVAQKILK
ncbi:MAG: hypothetical protein WCF23_10765 [Candidatus Nitrosopolaris sp.]